MADYQKVVEFLRDFRASPVQTVTDEVRQAAADFADLCTQANDRLRRSAVLLQQGLRAEAIHLADASPNLLDLVAALDLPDAEAWAEFCQRQDLPVPPALQIDRASQLNDAYGQDQPLEELFARHRRLALGHAAVGRRLDVMRRIAQLDPSPFWSKDIRTFEYARFKELRVALSGAIQQKDVPGLTTLAHELLDTTWIEPVPADLQTAARDVHERLRLARMDEQLHAILDQLRTAFAAKSLPECAAGVSQARRVLEENGTPNIPDAMAAEFQPIVEWVQQEKQLKAGREAFAASCAALTAALDGGAPDAALEAAYRAAAAHDQPLPDELRTRYEQTLRRRASALHRRYIIVAAAVAALLAVALGVAWQVVQSRETRGWAERIHKAAVDRDLSMAGQLIAEQERRAPRLNDAPAVAAAKGEVAVLREQAERDGKALSAALADLDSATRAANAAAAADPPDPAALAAALDGADAALARRRGLRGVAWVDAQDRLGATATRLEGLRDTLRDRAVRSVTDQADAVANQINQVSVEPRASSLAQADAALTAAENALLPLRARARGDGPAAHAVDAAAKKLAERREAVANARAQVDARRNLALRATNAASTRQALDEFAKRFPDAPASADFAKAIDALPGYAAVEAWEALAGAWAAAPAPSSDHAATERLQALREYLHNYPGSPRAAAASAYADYLRQAADALALQNSWQAALGEVVSLPLIADLKYLQASDGQRYYVLGDPAIRFKAIGDRQLVTFDAIDPANLSRKRPVTVNPPRTLVTDKPLPVPHAAFVQTMVEQMKTIDPSNWDTWGIDEVARLVADDKMEPVVRATLLRDVMVAASTVAGWGIGDAYERSINDLTRQRLEQVVWYDADRPVPEVTVANLKRIVADVPKADAVRRTLAAKRTAIFQALRPVFGGASVLLRDEAGELAVAAPAPLPDGSAAWAVVPPPGGYPAPRAAAAEGSAPPTTEPVEGQPATAPAVAPAAVPGARAKFARVALWKNGAAVLDRTVAGELPEGTMVLFTRP